MYRGVTRFSIELITRYLSFKVSVCASGQDRNLKSNIGFGKSRYEVLLHALSHVSDHVTDDNAAGRVTSDRADVICNTYD